MLEELFYLFSERMTTNEERRRLGELSEQFTEPLEARLDRATYLALKDRWNAFIGAAEAYAFKKGFWVAVGLLTGR